MKTELKIGKKLLVLLAVTLAMAAAPSAQAALSLVGPINTANGFPQWYQDGTGVRLDLPTPPLGDGLGLLAPTQIFDAPDPLNPFSAQIGFGTEAFYYLCESVFETAMGRFRARFGLEASFFNGFTAINGEQIVFTRIRFTLPAATVPGNYTIDHPYGQTIVPLTAADIAAGKGLKYTEDIGITTPLAFNLALAGNIGPFLKATTLAVGVDPAAWIGDGVTIGTVTGSPIGFNSIRITGPRGSILDPVTGSNVIEVNNQFMVSGHIPPNAPPVPVGGADLVTPVPGSTLPIPTTVPLPTVAVGGRSPATTQFPSPTTFVASASRTPGATAQLIWVGNAPKASDLGSAPLVNQSATLNMPIDGRKLYVTLWALVNNVWQVDGQFILTAATARGATIVSPATPSVLPKGGTTFTWDTGAGIPRSYGLWVGKTPGAKDIFGKALTVNSQKMSLPSGQTVYVTLWSWVNSQWKSKAFTYTTAAK
ncbi:MAG: hypothetical protein HZC54_00010 [Verrucomicrobia bacterium]|nr:hypothetical protein [Verrucomicrobiota bacterium]